MIIKKITLKNFRSYEDETTFDFTPRDGKNIVLIGGENGAGKSTLFQALKVCFYGPYSYGYVGANSAYTSKIKANINYNAFKDDSVNAYVAIDISLTEGTEENSYTLRRTWDYIDLKLIEDFKVYKNGELLSESETLYFENFIKTIMPPSLFEFFFFDGEDLAEHFVGNSANTHIKEAMLELCNYDTFEILKKSLLQYQRSNNSLNDNIKLKQDKYDEILSQTKNLASKLENLSAQLKEKSITLEELNIKKNKLIKDFKEAGGLLETEKAMLTVTYSRLEAERDEINTSIKNYCNNILPFMMSTNLLKKIKKQLSKEKELSSYETMKTKLNQDVLKNVVKELEGINNNINYSEFSKVLLKNMFSSEITQDKITAIHNLSFEQENSVHSVINSIEENFDSNKTSLSKKYSRLKEIASEIKTVRERLTSSLEEKILEDYLKDTEILSAKISELQKSISVLEHEISNCNIDKNKLDNQLVRAKNEYTTALQGSNTLNLSEEIVACLNSIILKLTSEKTKILEEKFTTIFKKLIRKDSYIDSIEFDENFNPTLYVDKEYSSLEIYNLINNLGLDDLKKKHGNKFLDSLVAELGVTTKKDLLNELMANPFRDLMKLSTKVNINGFSSGEKQIYILCLIWALIKTSDVEVPFIIDTPYARIDETHRNALTTTYLPNISNQVIILSTNEEIDHDAYLTIKDYLCNEYLLEYLNKERKTIVHNNYFFKSKEVN